MFNIDGYEDFRLKHSLILNQKTVKGTLHLSIHPLDFITMSDNKCGWDSCMSWANNGSYRRGTVEMMNSPYVLVAYITGKHNIYSIDNYQWNNKKWRELFIISQDIISNIKGYPYIDDSFDTLIINWIKELAQKNLNIHYEKNLHMITDGEDIEDFNSKFQVSYFTDAMYNDCYKQTVCFSEKFLENPHNLYIDYSGLSTCVICGCEGEDEFYTEQSLSCCECSKNKVCSSCGDLIYESDEAIEFNGQLLCTSCYSDLVGECSCCGIEDFNEDLNEINLLVDNKIHLNIYGFFCDNCCMELSEKIKIYMNIKYIDINDISEIELNDWFNETESSVQDKVNYNLKMCYWNIIDPSDDE